MAGMQWSLRSFPLGKGGLDGRNDPRWLPFGSYAALRNADLGSPGAIKKRPGFTALSMTTFSGDTIGSTYPLIRVAARKQELLALSSPHIYSRSTQTGNKWSNPAAAFSTVTHPLLQYYQFPTNYPSDARTQDQASTGSLSVYAWEDSGGTVKYVAVDTVGTRSSDVSGIGNAIRPKCQAYGGFVWLYWVDSSSWALKVRKFTPGSTTTADTTLASDVVNSATTSSYDVCPIGTPSAATSCALIYVSTTATTAKVRMVDSTPAVSASTYDWNHGGATASSVCITANATYVGVAATIDAAANNVVTSIRSATDLSAVTTGTLSTTDATYRNSTCLIVGTTLVVLYEKAGSSSYLNQVLKGTTTTAGVSGGDSIIARRSCLASKVVNATEMVDAGGQPYYVVLAHASTLQSTYFLYKHRGIDIGGGVDYFDWQVAGKIFQATAGGATARTGHLPQLEPRSSTELFFCALRKRKLEAGSVAPSTTTPLPANAAYAQRQVVGVSFIYDTAKGYNTAVLGESLYIAGAQLLQYDGAHATECGFHLYPENFTVATSATAGSLVNGTTYWWRVYFERYNAQGERELSTLAAAFSGGPTGGNTSVDITLPTLIHTTGANLNGFGTGYSIGLAVYRTTGTPTATSPFYRVSSTDPTATGSNGWVSNVTNADTLSFNDGLADADLVKRELDYQNLSTVGSELDNIAPPACRVIAASGNRLFIAGLEDGNQIWASKLRQPGDAASFSDALTIDVPDDGGAISALAVLDNMLFIFKQSKVYVIDATGPDNFGNGQQFGDPRLVTGDVGAIDWRSVVVAKPGIFFHSHKGLRLVTRGLEVKDAGAAAESSFAGQTVLSACAPVGTNQVRFQMASQTMVYDYELDYWSTHTDPGTRGQVSFVDASGTAQLYIASSTKVLARDTTVWTDDGSSYELRFKTGVISFGSLQGHVRVREVGLAGTYKSAHTMNLTVYYNGPDGSTTGTNYTRAAATAYQERVRLAQQKCQSIQVEFYESAGSGTGQVAELHELQFEVGMKRGAQPLPSAQSV